MYYASMLRLPPAEILLASLALETDSGDERREPYELTAELRNMDLGFLTDLVVASTTTRLLSYLPHTGMTI
jgi:hypothetical protein